MAQTRETRSSPQYTVGEMARHAGVTIRTLHHYDELGLVVAHRQPNGHRVYGQAAMELLQQVRFYRELGFPLDRIKRIMTDPRFDRGAALKEQHAMLVEQLNRTHVLVDAVRTAIKIQEQGAR